jgi:hypothetical protein
MKRRFSDHELYILRNEIPIQVLIETKLKIPNKIRDGFFRFLCPCCGEFNTAIKKETNLAKCFISKKDFNTIDMTLEVTTLDFVESVHFLQKFHKELSCKADDKLRDQPTIQFDMDRQPVRRRKCIEPIPTKVIYEDMIGNATRHDPKESDNHLLNQKGQVMIRLEKVENEINRLSRQIEHIHTFLKNHYK